MIIKFDIHFCSGYALPSNIDASRHCDITVGTVAKQTNVSLWSDFVANGRVAACSKNVSTNFIGNLEFFVPVWCSPVSLIESSKNASTNFIGIRILFRFVWCSWKALLVHNEVSSNVMTRGVCGVEEKQRWLGNSQNDGWAVSVSWRLEELT